MLSLPPLYPITDARSSIPLSEQIRRLGAAGFPLVQFRGKPLAPPEQWLQLKEALQDSHQNGGWPMICINDRADLAVLAGMQGIPAWGLHLGQDDLPPRVALGLPGLSGLHLGTSTHGMPEWAKIDPACDHAGLGPFRATTSKGDHAAPIGLEGLRQGCAILRGQGVAPVAIGGLTLADADDCFQAGAESLAMIGEIAQAEDPAEVLWSAQCARWRARPPVDPKRGLVLVGGSGCGKSSLARAIARRSGLPCSDLDDVTENHAGKSIARIFAEDGEAAFRGLEEECLPSQLWVPRILAVGGGAWQSPRIRRAVEAAAFQVLWIAENPATAWARVGADRTRPLARERRAFMELWRSRMARWAEVPMLLPLGRDPEELAGRLLAPC
jgi:thiamine-phosphate diphosphorylase